MLPFPKGIEQDYIINNWYFKVLISSPEIFRSAIKYFEDQGYYACGKPYIDLSDEKRKYEYLCNEWYTQIFSRTKEAQELYTKYNDFKT